MGNHSPSRYRREGRNAFYPGGDPESNCQYKSNPYNRKNWLEGWAEAKRDYVPPKPAPMGILESLREDFTDEQINTMPTVELIAAIESIVEARANI